MLRPLKVEIVIATPSHPAGRSWDSRTCRAGDTVIRAVEQLARRSAANRTLLEHELAVIDQVVRIAHRGERTTYAGTGTYASPTISLLDAKA